jgi:hypothetical protein
MKKVFCMAVISGALLTSGCVGSPAWYLKHKEQVRYEIGDYEVVTVPMGPDRFDAFVGKAKNFDMIEFKGVAIEAIEKRSGCKVVDSGFNPPRAIGVGYILQAKVECAK